MPLDWSKFTAEQLDKYFHAMRDFTQKAVDLGVALVTAMDAFHEKYLPHPERFGAVGAYEQLPPEAKAACDEAVAGAQSD